jgi:hypothetical protein
MSQDLNQDELNELADLLVISQKAKAREALCIKIGISYYKELGFIHESSDSSFAINLINHLNDVGNTKALYQLCCKELVPIFKGGKRESILKEIALKLDCNHYNKISEQPISPMPSPVPPEFAVNDSNPLYKSKPESWFTKIGNTNKKLLACGAIIIIGLTGFSIVQSFNNPGSPPQTTSVTVAYQGDYYRCSLPIDITIGNKKFFPRGYSYTVNNIEIGKQEYQISGNISCPTGSLRVVCQVSGNGLINVVPDKTYQLSWQNTAYGQCEAILQ